MWGKSLGGSSIIQKSYINVLPNPAQSSQLGAYLSQCVYYIKETNYAKSNSNSF